MKPAAVGVSGRRGGRFDAIVHTARGTRRVGERSTPARDLPASGDKRLAAVVVIRVRGGRCGAIVHPARFTR